MSTFVTMSPWDAFAWFDTPVETMFAMTGSAVLIAKGNPRRIALGLAPTQSGSNITISSTPLVSSNVGFVLSSSVTPTWILQANHGPFCQGQMWAFGMALSNLWVCEIFLRDWPDRYKPDDYPY